MPCLCWCEWNEVKTKSRSRVTCDPVLYTRWKEKMEIQCRQLEVAAQAQVLRRPFCDASSWCACVQKFHVNIIALGHRCQVWLCRLVAAQSLSVCRLSAFLLLCAHRAMVSRQFACILWMGRSMLSKTFLFLASHKFHVIAIRMVPHSCLWSLVPLGSVMASWITWRHWFPWTFNLCQICEALSEKWS
jgi:hypothetical protein